MDKETGERWQVRPELNEEGRVQRYRICTNEHDRKASMPHPDDRLVCLVWKEHEADLIAGVPETSAELDRLKREKANLIAAANTLLTYDCFENRRNMQVTIAKAKEGRD